MNTEIYGLIATILTLICGGGWFINRRAKKQLADAEAWKAQQAVYQDTIADLKESCDYIRKDRDLLRKENEQLRNENSMLREKIFELEKQFADVRRDIARQGRRIESLTNKTKKTKDK